MKIIKEGKKMITGTINVTCTTCEAELQINVNDLTKEMLSDLRKRINP